MKMKDIFNIQHSQTTSPIPIKQGKEEENIDKIATSSKRYTIIDQSNFAKAYNNVNSFLLKKMVIYI